MTTRRRLLLCAAALSMPLGLCGQSARFQADIQRLLERDKTNPPPRDGILFIGSSIFRLWTQLDQQMAPLPVFNRAFGGSVTQDWLDRADQLVIPYKPRIIVYYCGSNDVNAGASADAVVARTKQFLGIVNQRLPDTFVYYTAIQKAPDKRDRWDVIDLNPVLFDKQGKLRENLFLPDQLHFRPESTAYAEFAQVVKPTLTKAWQDGAGLPKK